SDLQEMLSVFDRVAKLTRQLLTFSRSGVIQPHLLQINTVIEDIERILQRALGEDVMLTCDLAEDLPNIAADVGHLEQVLLNLAVNARDAMPGGGRLNVSTRLIQRTELKGHVLPNDRQNDYVLL